MDCTAKVVDAFGKGCISKANLAKAVIRKAEKEGIVGKCWCCCLVSEFELGYPDAIDEQKLCMCGEGAVCCVTFEALFVEPGDGCVMVGSLSFSSSLVGVIGK